MIASQAKQQVCLSQEQYAAYACVSYFQIFGYPPKIEEIHKYCDVIIDLAELETVLNDLSYLGYLQSEGPYYSTSTSIRNQVSKRIDSEKRFEKKLKTIKRYARFVAAFPYIECVGISGSCSRGLFEVDGDVDYFVITTPGRLWVCRTILMLFKKVFLLNSKKYFCLNYFVDSTALRIPDENIFVAHEIKSMAPVNNQLLFDQFLDANLWTKQFLPNHSSLNTTFLEKDHSKPLVKKLLETILNGKLGTALENWCFSITLKTWKRKFPDLQPNDFEQRFRSLKNVSKHHPRGFQNRVLSELQQKLTHINVLP